MRAVKFLLVAVAALVLAGGTVWGLDMAKGSKAEAVRLAVHCVPDDPDTDGAGPDTGTVVCTVKYLNRSGELIPVLRITIEYNDRNENGRPDFRDQKIGINVECLPGLPIPLPICSRP